jgi:hypothetical protein
MRVIATVVIQLLLVVPFANAQSTAGAMKEFGLFGTWAGDCYRPPSPANEFSVFSLTSSGAVELQNDFGTNYGDMIYKVIDVKRVGESRLSLRQMLTNDDRVVLDTVILRETDRIRTWSSHLTDGSALVEDGAVPAANGQVTGWKNRCDVRRADRFTVPGNRGPRHFGAIADR